ncbi:MAG TPA: Ig-like domain-containing protein [Gaiellaceae bacterium]|nr:Ig-like domain-containing protein [Gaiellaceae bacterium]
MKRQVTLAALLFALAAAVAGTVTAAASAGPIEVAITSPADGAHSLNGVVDVEVTASATAGIYGVQLLVDGAAYGQLVTTPVGQYRYQIAWDTSTATVGSHTLAVTAFDWSQPYPDGAQLTSSPITVDVGPAYPTVAIATPQAWTFVRGATPVRVDFTSAIGPVDLHVTLDGAELTPSSMSPWTASWDTTSTADGSHVIAASVTDGRGKTASASVTVTVDNTAPSAAIVSPTGGAYAVGSLAAQAQVSDAFGAATVQFVLDGHPAGAVLTQPDSGTSYNYSATLDLTGLAAGAHTVAVTATDRAGNSVTSAPVSFTVGTAPPGVVISSPADWSFARAVVPVTALVAGGVSPVTARLVVDGVATSVTATAPPYVLFWDTKKLSDGTHLVAVTVVDAQGRSTTSAAIHETVDNTPPSGFTIAPTANQRITGTTTFQAHASDAYGVASVQFLVDGTPVGALLTAPDAGQLYLYSLQYDTTTLPAGTHVVTVRITDNAGNQTTLAGVAITTGAVQYLPVLNFHEINPPDGYTIYDETPSQADAELAWLKANGYQSVTLEQYQQWLGGQSVGVAKPVLITVDDALKSEKAWDPLLAKYGFKAVLFVITGWVDNKTPADADPNNMSWNDIRALAATGRWQIAFHAGLYGHGDSYGSGARIGNQVYQSSCPYFYTCLSGTKSGSTWKAESVTAFETAVTNEVNNGLAELRQMVPGASLVAWAAPFNDAGQWTTLYNDPSGQVQSWLPGFFASRFPIVFTQTNPVTYGQASGLVGSLTSFDRHYRFEVHTDTTIAQFAAAMIDPAFAR